MEKIKSLIRTSLIPEKQLENWSQNYVLFLDFHMMIQLSDEEVRMGWSSRIKWAPWRNWDLFLALKYIWRMDYQPNKGRSEFNFTFQLMRHQTATIDSMNFSS